MICPVCKKPLEITVKEQASFVGGNLTLVSMVCGNCSFRSFDIIPSESGNPSRITFHVKSEQDLNVLVARGASASILIPEIGASIKPGTASPGFITTIEGVLQKFKKHMKNQEAQALIDRLLDGAPFTIIVEDPYGVSAINSLEVEIENL